MPFLKPLIYIMTRKKNKEADVLLRRELLNGDILIISAQKEYSWSFFYLDYQVRPLQNGSFRSLCLSARFLRQAHISILEIFNIVSFCHPKEFFYITI